MDNVNKYPYLVNNEDNQNLLKKKDKCDKYDYITAIACGAIGGMIDIFLVGAPGDSVLGKWTDKQVDNAVMGFAKKLGWNPKASNTGNANSAIGFLERKFKVNYDQRKPSDVNDLFNISPNSHHMMSLAHSPDIIGLFFSILNQFTLTKDAVANGRLVTIATDTFELQGGNFIMKIMCGIANWFGHLMSDVAGSSGSHGRGTGIVMPFYELFGFCKFGSFNTADGKKDLAEVAMQAFNQGLDFRFGLTQAIPLVITELSIRLIWAIRRKFQYRMPIRDCIPSMKHDTLRVMLIIGNGTLCFMDGADALIRSGGNAVLFFMRMNIVAWFRFATLVLKEVFIRLGIVDSIQRTIEAFKRINVALLDYLHKLEQIDVALFKEETRKYNELVMSLDSAKSDKDLNRLLLNMYDEYGISKPWQGDFNEHMSNKNGTLRFE